MAMAMGEFKGERGATVSWLRPICCAGGTAVHICPIFRCVDQLRGLKTGPICPRSPTRLAMIAQVRQAVTETLIHSLDVVPARPLKEHDRGGPSFTLSAPVPLQAGPCSGGILRTPPWQPFGPRPD